MKNRTKNIGLILVLMIALCAVVFSAPKSDPRPTYGNPVYMSKLFDSSRIHTINIETDHWQDLLDNALEEQYYQCNITIDGEMFKDVAVRTKGNNSLRLTNRYGHDRYSLKIEFDHYIKGYSYYGLDKFCLDSSFQDNSYMKTHIAFDMFRSMGVATPLDSYVWVTVNGEDWGLFLAIEEPEEAFAKRNWGPDHGILYKPDYKSLNDKNSDVALKYIDDNPQSYDNIFRKAKFNISINDKQRLIDSLQVLSTGDNLETAVNIDSVIDYFVVQTFVVNMDSYLGKTGHNYFLYEKDGIISMLPWDYNLAFATYSLGMPNPVNDSTLYINYPINTPASGEIMLNRPLYHNLMQNKKYFAQYHRRYKQFIKNYFDSGYFNNFINETVTMIAPYVQKDPTAFCNYQDFLKGAKTIQNFCLLRRQSVAGQLEDTIPATIREQSKDKSSFIDGESIWLPDMGEIRDLKNGVH